MMAVIAAAVAAVAAVVSTPRESFESKIAGGTEVNDADRMREFPWHCALYDARAQYVCGGVLIGPDAVLTAKHGTTIPDRQIKRVKVGNAWHAVKYIIRHPKRADIAVVRLATRSSLPVIKIADRLPVDCASVTAIGEGIHQPGSPRDGKFRKTSMTFVPSRAKLPCVVRPVPNVPFITQLVATHLFNVYSLQGRICFDDSGSAILLGQAGSYVLLGIVHGAVSKCGMFGNVYHGLGTDAVFWKPWIEVAATHRLVT